MDQEMVVSIMSALSAVAMALKCAKSSGIQVVGGRVIVGKEQLGSAANVIDKCVAELTMQLFGKAPIMVPTTAEEEEGA